LRASANEVVVVPVARRGGAVRRVVGDLGVAVDTLYERIRWAAAVADEC